MPCWELERLRQQIRGLNTQLLEQRRRAREMAHEARGSQMSGRSDYELVITKRLQRLSAEIEQHLAQHKCQE